MMESKSLGNGDLAKKLTVEGCKVSASAKEKIEKAGGSIADDSAGSGVNLDASSP